MRHVDGSRAALLADAPDFATHLNPQFGIQVAQRLVQQQEVGADHQSPGQRNPLLLTAGECIGLSISHACKPSHFNDFRHPVFDLFLGNLPHFEAEADVLRNGHMGPEGVALKDHADVALVWRQRRHILSTEADLTRVWRTESGQHPQQGGLATS